MDEFNSTIHKHGYFVTERLNVALFFTDMRKSIYIVVMSFVYQIILCGARAHCMEREEKHLNVFYINDHNNNHYYYMMVCRQNILFMLPLNPLPLV